VDSTAVNNKLYINFQYSLYIRSQPEKNINSLKKKMGDINNREDGPVRNGLYSVVAANDISHALSHAT
jgi:hypothetical protein